MSPYGRKHQDRELEARIRQADGDYERYLLEDAYHHAAMRRRTRREAMRLTAETILDGAKLVAKAPDKGGQVVDPQESRPIQPEPRRMP